MKCVGILYMNRISRHKICWLIGYTSYFSVYLSILFTYNDGDTILVENVMDLHAIIRLNKKKCFAKWAIPFYIKDPTSKRSLDLSWKSHSSNLSLSPHLKASLLFFLLYPVLVPYHYTNTTIILLHVSSLLYHL